MAAGIVVTDNVVHACTGDAGSPERAPAVREISLVVHFSIKFRQEVSLRFSGAKVCSDRTTPAPFR